VSARIETRLTEVEQAVQRVERAAASESVARQTSIEALLRQISKRLEQAEEFVRHSEGLITDRAVREVSARIETRLTEVERAVQRVERAAASESVARQTSIEALLRQISKRLEQAEEFVRHSEGLIVERVVREVSACIDARATGADEVVRRIEQVVADTRVSEPSPWLVPLVPPVSQRVTKRLAAAGALVAVAIFVLVTRVPIAGQPEPVSRAVDREVLLRDALVEAPAPLAVVLRPMSMPTVALTPAPARLPARSTPPAAPRPQTSTRRATVPAEADDVAPRSFVGDLTITSTPVGATVSINGRAAGVTPLVLRERPAGSVAVQINNDGFERWSASVQVRAGEMTNVSATLRRAQ
jgi:HEPN domain-containing protein